MATWLYTDTVSFGSLRSYYPISFRYAYYVESTSSGRRLNLQIQLMNNHSSENYTDTLYACGSTNGTDLATLTANNTSLVTSGSMNLGDASYPIRLTAKQTWYTLGYNTSDNAATFIYDFSNNGTAITISFNGMFSSQDFDTTSKKIITHTFYFNPTSGGSTISESPVAGIKIKMGDVWLPNSIAYAKYNNTWKRIIRGWAKINNEWHLIKKGAANVILSGAVSETITATHSSGATYFINTNIEGLSASTQLPLGTYTITGSVSNYSKSINITDDGTYTAYPDDAVYWYGREFIPLVAYATTGQGALVIERGTNGITCYNSNWGAKFTGILSTETAVDFSKYDTCCIITYEPDGSNANQHVGVNKTQPVATYGSTFTSSIVPDSTTSKEYTFDISTWSSGYPGVQATEYNKGYYSNRKIAIEAIYMKGTQISINGAPNENLILTHSDGTVYEYTTNDNGIAIVQIKNGTYTVQTPHYTRTITISGAGSYNAYPEGAIFWYGNGDNENDSLYNKFGGFIADSQLRPDVGNVGKVADFTFTQNINSYEINYSWRGTGSGYVIIANAYMKQPISTSGYSKIHIAGSMSGSGGWYTTNSLTHEFTPIATVNTTPAEIEIGQYLTFTQSKYVDPYGSIGNTIKIDAIWLE